MQFLRSQVVLSALLVFASCHDNVHDEDRPGRLVRLSPTGVSTNDAWKLFDRSLSSGFVPTRDAVHVELARDTRVLAVKVRGGVPYSMTLGGATTDLSKLGDGWHAIAARSSNAVDVSFEPRGAPSAPVPELELWGIAGHDDVASAVAREATQSLAPGSCATFHVELTRHPASFSRTYLVYEANLIVRPFALQRSVNGERAVGGAWMRGAASSHELRDEFDPEQLQRGENTIRLCSPAAATDTVSVSKLRIVGELDTGTYVIENASASGVLPLPRLLAPTAIVGDATLTSVACIGANGTKTAMAAKDRGDYIELQGDKLACAALAVETKATSDITVIGSTAGDRIDLPKLVITSAPEHFGDVAWISGFVARPPAMNGAIRVSVADRADESMTGTFGQLVSRKRDASGAWTVDIAAHLPDSSKHTATVVLASDRRADVASGAAQVATSSSVDVARFGKLGVVATGNANMLAETTVNVGSDAGVVIPAGAVVRPTRTRRRSRTRRTTSRGPNRRASSIRSASSTRRIRRRPRHIRSSSSSTTAAGQIASSTRAPASR